MAHPHIAAEASNADRDEVLGKIGRNMLLFQQAEHRLKWLAARRRIAGLPEDIVTAAGMLKEQVAKETLGTVVRRTIDAPCISEREQERIDAAILEKNCVHLEFSFEFSGADSEIDTAWREGLEALVEHRNDLVHHFLERFELVTLNGCQMASQYLDQQHARHAPLVEDLRRHCDGVSSAIGMLSAAMNQDDILAEFLHGHLRLKLDEVLRRVAADKARADGWTYLSLAGDALADENCALLKCLEQAFGHCGLKQAVAAMEGWRLREERTGGGGLRLLYRFAESDHAIE